MLVILIFLIPDYPFMLHLNLLLVNFSHLIDIVVFSDKLINIIIIFKDLKTGRLFLVFFPFADRYDDERFGCSLAIRVIPDAHVSQFIGLCCYKFMWSGRTPWMGLIYAHLRTMA